MLEESSKKTKTKKGWLVVRVGLEQDYDDADGGFRRFTIPISYLYYPQFTRLLEEAHETYGYHSSGPLRLSCSVDDFHHVIWLIEGESQKSSSLSHGSSHQKQRRHYSGASFSFH